jgi:hypothetical protein
MEVPTTCDAILRNGYRLSAPQASFIELAKALDQ